MFETSIVTAGDMITTIMPGTPPIVSTFPIVNTNQSAEDFVFIETRAMACAGATNGGATINSSQTKVYIHNNSITTVGASGSIAGGSVSPIPTPGQNWTQFVFIEM